MRKRGGKKAALRVPKDAKSFQSVPRASSQVHKESVNRNFDSHTLPPTFPTLSMDLFLCRTEKCFGFASKKGQLGFNDVPDEAIVYVGIAVNQNVSKGDYATMLANALHESLVQLCELRERLADDFELPFSAERSIASPR